MIDVALTGMGSMVLRCMCVSELNEVLIMMCSLDDFLTISFPVCIISCRKNIVYNFSEAEVKVREATSNDVWGPSAVLMREISEYTFNV